MVNVFAIGLLYTYLVKHKVYTSLPFYGILFKHKLVQDPRTAVVLATTHMVLLPEASLNIGNATFQVTRSMNDNTTLLIGLLPLTSPIGVFETNIPPGMLSLIH